MYEVMQEKEFETEDEMQKAMNRGQLIVAGKYESSQKELTTINHPFILEHLSLIKNTWKKNHKLPIRRAMRKIEKLVVPNGIRHTQVNHLQAMDLAVEDIKHLHPSLNIRVTATALLEEE